MRRRVVCPRSHPASPYARRLLGGFGGGSQCFPRGTTPRTPRVAPCLWGLRRWPGSLAWGAAGPGVLLSVGCGRVCGWFALCGHCVRGAWLGWVRLGFFGFGCALVDGTGAPVSLLGLWGGRGAGDLGWMRAWRGRVGYGYRKGIGGVRDVFSGTGAQVAWIGAMDKGSWLCAELTTKSGRSVIDWFVFVIEPSKPGE